MIKGADIVIAIGNTGAGKSTLLNSLVFGTEKLEMKTTDKKKKVIDQKDGFKSLGQLKIGHQMANS